MEAKVKDNARFKKYNLFDSNEFFKGEWKPVPAGFEEQAREEKLLDIREDVQDLPKAVIVEKLPPVILPAEDYEYVADKFEDEEKPRKRGRKRKDESGEFASTEVED